jgi:transglutaminase-like putative cysteine protease
MRLEGYQPDHTTEQAVMAMMKYAREQYTHPEVQKAVAEVTNGINPRDRRSLMIATMNWILSKMKYVFDQDESRRLFGTTMDVELVKSPTAVLESKRYDCDCISTLITAIFLALGIPTRIVTVSFHPIEQIGPDGFEHVFVQGFDDVTNSWFVIDPVSHPNETNMIAQVTFSRIYDV